MCSTVLLRWLCHWVCHVVVSFGVKGSMHYLVAYNLSVRRGLDTKLSTCGN